MAMTRQSSLCVHIGQDTATGIHPLKPAGRQAGIACYRARLVIGALGPIEGLDPGQGAGGLTQAARPDGTLLPGRVSHRAKLAVGYNVSLVVRHGLDTCRLSAYSGHDVLGGTLITHGPSFERHSRRVSLSHGSAIAFSHWFCLPTSFLPSLQDPGGFALPPYTGRPPTSGVRYVISNMYSRATL
ncbi:hypothetical protein V2G26_000717 [Clonostachys chloroleuca]